MRELERDSSSELPACTRLAVVGRGRMGSALASALAAALPCDVVGPLGRGAAPGDVDAVLLCVPDGEIASAAALIPDGVLVGHCSGATGLDVLGGHADAFSLHPLMTVTGATGAEFAGAGAGAEFAGAGAAIAGSTPRALAMAQELAEVLGMRPFEVEDGDRAAYHAAASIASNFLITLEAAAERLAASAGVPRQALVPLVRASVENWAALGPSRALTGPVARGDVETVARQRLAVQEREPELLALFDALVESTEALVLNDGDLHRRGRYNHASPEVVA